MQQSKTKCAIYTRVSTDMQAEVEFNSCMTQELKIRSFIESQNDMEVYKVYSDEGYTGSNIDRPALSELLRHIEEGKIDVVMAYKIDRLTRSPKDFYYLIEILEKYNVSFISVTERFDTSTPSGRLLRNIMLTFGQFERELVSERTKDKFFERAKKGLFGGGAAPLGYQRVDKKLVIEPEEAKTVHFIFDKFVETGSLSQVCDALKQKGIVKRKGKAYTKGDLSSLLKKSVYIGKVIHLGKLYQGIHEPLICEEQFEQVQSLRLHRVAPKHSPSKYNLFAGLIVCKECGSIMSLAFTNKMKNNLRKRYFYYRCSCTSKKGWSACSTKQVSASRLDVHVLENLRRIINDTQYLESLSYTLNHRVSGYDDGLEPWKDRPAFSPETIKVAIKNVVKGAAQKGTIRKEIAMGKHIKNIIYSKGEIEIKLFKPDDFSPDTAKKLEGIDDSPQPKMDG
ncbi:MAG: recombinase family protein, partial [bacterium]